jgi:metallophosphoesterase superfamily enzyme
MKSKIKLLKSNTLVIADLHEPFTREGYLEHCAKVRDQYNCGNVVFIGDIIDNHYSSYHESDPDGYSAGEELDRAVDKISQWYKVFPKAKVTLGNHDLIIMRKAYSSGISSKWIKGYSEVLNTKGWEFDTYFDIDNARYVHGTNSSGPNAAMKKVVNWGCSVIQGHIHTECNVQWITNKADRRFAMIVGWGGDEESYAFAYGKNFPKRGIVSCGVVTNGGKNAFNVPMDL